MNTVMQPTPETMHRGAKMFMDRGEAVDYEAALAILGGFRLAIIVGRDIAVSIGSQVALLTAVNVARRSFLGGVFVSGCPDAACLTPLGGSAGMRHAVFALGGILTDEIPKSVPLLVIGGGQRLANSAVALRVTWGGWSGGVVHPGGHRLAEDSSCPVAAVLAACIGVSELFQAHTGDIPDAGRRSVGLSLWQPSAHWADVDAGGPDLQWLPSHLWLIGLGNLGQAYLWCLGALPYEQPSQVQLVLQDFDEIEQSNDSTSVLSHLRDIGTRKTRMSAAWAEGIGFRCRLMEGRFGAWTKRSDEAEDPTVALFGVDNAYACGFQCIPPTHTDFKSPIVLI